MTNRVSAARWVGVAAALSVLASVALATTAISPATTTITIVQTAGPESFIPNPTTVAAGDSIVWQNNDSLNHEIAFDDGSLRTGNIPPGASSAPIALIRGGGSYHCTIHPTMVGTIIGAPCTFTLAPTSANVPAAPSGGTVNVTAPSGCTWTAVSNSGFITVTSGGSGSGNGTASYSVAANMTGSPRAGSMTIGGQTFTITQAAGQAPCAIVLAPPTLPNVTQGVAMDLPLTASGGAAPYVFAVTAASVPAGLALSSGGVLSGTPTTAGASTFTVRATDVIGCFGELADTLTVVTAVPTLPQTVVLLLGAGLIGLGWWRVARRSEAASQ